MKIYYVDLPNPHAASPDDSWTNVAICGTLREAETLLDSGWGINREQCALFITEGTGELSDLHAPAFCEPEDSRL